MSIYQNTQVMCYSYFFHVKARLPCTADGDIATKETMTHPQGNVASEYLKKKKKREIGNFAPPRRI